MAKTHVIIPGTKRTACGLHMVFQSRWDAVSTANIDAVSPEVFASAGDRACSKCKRAREGAVRRVEKLNKRVDRIQRLMAKASAKGDEAMAAAYKYDLDYVSRRLAVASGEL